MKYRSKDLFEIHRITKEDVLDSLKDGGKPLPFDLKVASIDLEDSDPGSARFKRKGGLAFGVKFGDFVVMRLPQSNIDIIPLEHVDKFYEAAEGDEPKEPSDLDYLTFRDAIDILFKAEIHFAGTDNGEGFKWSRMELEDALRKSLLDPAYAPKLRKTFK